MLSVFSYCKYQTPAPEAYVLRGQTTVTSLSLAYLVLLLLSEHKLAGLR